jgi:hypothetical protein
LAALLSFGVDMDAVDELNFNAYQTSLMASMFHVSELLEEQGASLREPERPGFFSTELTMAVHRELLAKRNFRTTYEEFDRARKGNEKSQKTPPWGTLSPGYPPLEERDRMLEARWKYEDAGQKRSDMMERFMRQEVDENA